MNQEEVADKLNVKRQTYGAYERGVSVPDAYTLGKLADMFGVSADYLLGRTDIPEGYLHKWTGSEGKEVEVLTTSQNTPTPKEREDLQALAKSIRQDPAKHGALMFENADALETYIRSIVKKQMSEPDIDE